MPEFFADTGGLDGRIEQSRRYQDELRREIDLLKQKLNLEQSTPGGGQQLTDSTGSPKSSLSTVNRTAPAATEGSFFTAAIAGAAVGNRQQVSHIGAKIPTSTGISTTRTIESLTSDVAGNIADIYTMQNFRKRAVDVMKRGGGASVMSQGLTQALIAARPKLLHDMIASAGPEQWAAISRQKDARLRGASSALGEARQRLWDMQQRQRLIESHMGGRQVIFSSQRAGIYGMLKGVGQLNAEAKTPAARDAVFGKIAARSFGTMEAATIAAPSWASPEQMALAVNAVKQAQRQVRLAEKRLVYEQLNTPGQIARGLKSIAEDYMPARILGGDFLAMQAERMRRRQRFGRVMRREAIFAFDRFKAAGGVFAPISEVKNIVSSSARRAAYRGASAVKAQGGLIGSIINPTTLALAGKGIQYAAKGAFIAGAAAGGVVLGIKALAAANRKYFIEPLQNRSATIESSMATQQMIHENFMENVNSLGVDEAINTRRELQDQARIAKDRIANSTAGSIFDRFGAYVTSKISGIDPIEEQQRQRGEQQGQRVVEIAKLRRRLGKRFDLSAGQVQADVTTARERVMSRYGIFERIAAENPDVALGALIGKTPDAVRAEIAEEATKITLERGRAIEEARKRSRVQFLNTPQRRYNDQEFRRKREATKDFILSQFVQWNPY